MGDIPDRNFAVRHKESGLLLLSQWSDLYNANILFNHMNPAFPGEYEVVTRSGNTITTYQPKE